MTMPATEVPLSDEPDYYALIGVTPETPPDEIRRVYGDRVRTAMDANDRDLFERLVAAFEVLKDDEKRQAYDKRRASTPLAPPREPTQMNRTVAPPLGGEPIQMISPSSTVLPGVGGTERTTLFTGTPGGIALPRVCAISLSPCPLIGRAVLPDEGFCPECGVQLGVALGDEITAVRLPFLRDETGREYSLRAGDNTVGRDGADVMLPDKSVSRRHARLFAAPGSLILEESGSTNGTKHQGNPIVAGQSLPVSDGDAIQFGSVKLTAVVPPVASDMLALPSPGRSGAERTILPALAAPEGINTAARLVGKDGTTHTLTGDRTTFGRRAGNTVVLSGDSFVSGNHGAVLYEGETFRVVDLGSTNGSKWNSKKLVPNAPQVLSNGDEITFGQTTFTFHAPGK